MLLKKRIMSRPKPKHVAIILDGNGRWAVRRKLSRQEGHRRGALNMKPIALAAMELGIDVLSVYAFSTENWRRPQAEIDYLMQLPDTFESYSKEDFEDYDVRVVFSGRRDRIDEKNLERIKRIEEESKDRKAFILNICLDYGGRDELVRASHTIAKQKESFSETTIAKYIDQPWLPDVDLLIRPGGQKRISNFLLWRIAYAELVFMNINWPAFKPRHLMKAIDYYQKRDRKFGGLKKEGR